MRSVLLAASASEQHQRMAKKQRKVTQETINNYTVPTDLAESNSSYRVEAFVPGFSKKEIRVEFSGSTLYIKGNMANPEEVAKIVNSERKENISEEEFRYLHTERSHIQRFERVVELPSNQIDTVHVTASLINGVLTVLIPKIQPLAPYNVIIE